MPMTLANWEERFAQATGRVKCAEGKVRAALLPVIPDRATWEEFLICVGAEWKNWKARLSERCSAPLKTRQSGPRFLVQL